MLLLGPAPQVPAPKPARLPKTIEAKQLSLVTSQSAVDAAPGTKISLYVDVFPKPKMHVYAPDQPGGYIRITLEIDGSREVRAAKPVFPKSSGYFFAPLNETFRVYETPFRIRQDITVRHNIAARGRAAAGHAATITGTLRYQACDDEVCYRPDEVKLTWTVALKSSEKRSARFPSNLRYTIPADTSEELHTHEPTDIDLQDRAVFDAVSDPGGLRHDREAREHACSGTRPCGDAEADQPESTATQRPC